MRDVTQPQHLTSKVSVTLDFNLSPTLAVCEQAAQDWASARRGFATIQAGVAPELRNCSRNILDLLRSAPNTEHSLSRSGRVVLVDNTELTRGDVTKAVDAIVMSVPRKKLGINPEIVTPLAMDSARRCELMMQAFDCEAVSCSLSAFPPTAPDHWGWHCDFGVIDRKPYLPRLVWEYTHAGTEHLDLRSASISTSLRSQIYRLGCLEAIIRTPKNDWFMMAFSPYWPRDLIRITPSSLSAINDEFDTLRETVTRKWPTEAVIHQTDAGDISLIRADRARGIYPGIHRAPASSEWRLVLSADLKHGKA